MEGNWLGSSELWQVFNEWNNKLLNLYLRKIILVVGSVLDELN